MKRILSILTLLLVIFLIAGCSNQASPDTPPPQTEDPGESRESVTLFDEIFYPVTEATFEDINGEYLIELIFSTARYIGELKYAYGEPFYLELDEFNKTGRDSPEAMIKINNGEFILTSNKESKPFIIEKIANCSLEDGIFRGTVEDEEKTDDIFIGYSVLQKDTVFKQNKTIEGIVHNRDGKNFVTGEFTVESLVMPDYYDKYLGLFSITYEFEVEIK